eukprot:Skav226918  [mRNA]  locus=scaffold1147:84042:89594:+ [translate_table: standard]
MTGAQPLLDPENGATEQGEGGHTTVRLPTHAMASRVQVASMELRMSVGKDGGGHGNTVTWPMEFCPADPLQLLTSGIPVLMEWGAEFILTFMILASYWGHFKPWISTKEEFHKATQLQIGKDGTPLGLNGALGSFGVFIGKIYRWFRPYCNIFKYSGIVMFVLVFLYAGLRHLLNFSQTVEINKACGIPLPTLSALMGPLLVLVGSGMYLTGIPVFMEIGAECLVLFLLVATFFVHFKPLQQATKGHQGPPRATTKLLTHCRDQSSRDAAALWAYDLVMREDCSRGTAEGLRFARDL